MATKAGPRPASSSSAASSADADSSERGGHSSKETKRPAPTRSETVATRAAYCGGGRCRPRGANFPRDSNSGRRRRMIRPMARLVTPLQRVLASAAVAIDAVIAVATAIAAWPVGAVVGVFPLMTIGVVATRRRARFRALAGLVAAVHIGVGLA